MLGSEGGHQESWASTDKREFKNDKTVSKHSTDIENPRNARCLNRVIGTCDCLASTKTIGLSFCSVFELFARRTSMYVYRVPSLPFRTYSCFFLISKRTHPSSKTAVRVPSWLNGLPENLGSAPG